MPSYLKDYQYNLPTLKANSVTTPYPLSTTDSLHQLTPYYHSFVLNTSAISEPKTYNAAIKHQCWKDAMNLEIQALQNNNTWTLTDLPPGKVLIGCKWVYQIKYNSDGSIQRYKARLVAKGYTQQNGIDYINTFSPVAKITTIRTLLAVAATKQWHLHQLDINNAFLHGDLHEDIYMQLPPGFHLSQPNQVCKLTKSLYGLKQASRQWNAKLTEFLISQGFSQAPSDPSLFIKKIDASFIALLIYVDDIILASNDLSMISAAKSSLHATFQIKDLGNLKFFLGFEIARSVLGINLNQRKYTLDLLEETGFTNCKPAPTPMVPLHKASSHASSPLQDISSYRRLIGKLLYLFVRISVLLLITSLSSLSILLLFIFKFFIEYCDI